MADQAAAKSGRLEILTDLVGFVIFPEDLPWRVHAMHLPGGDRDPWVSVKDPTSPNPLCQPLGTLTGMSSHERTWKENGRRTVLKPRSLMRQTMASKFCVMALGPCHSPSIMVDEVSKPNQLMPLMVSGSPAAPGNALAPCQRHISINRQAGSGFRTGSNDAPALLAPLRQHCAPKQAPALCLEICQTTSGSEKVGSGVCEHAGSRANL